MFLLPTPFVSGVRKYICQKDFIDHNIFKARVMMNVIPRS